MQNPSPSLLEALYSLKPNTIYTMASPKAIMAAAAYFSQNNVTGFRWGESGQLLQILFKGNPVLAVRFSFEDGSLISACDCGAAPKPACRHVLVAAMTIARVLHDAKFHETDLPAIRVVQFRHQLKIQPREASRANVYFAPLPSGSRFEIDYDSGRREASWKVTGPPEGMEWLKWQEREPERVAEAFCRWLQSKPAELDLEVRLPAGTMRLSEVRSRELTGRVLLQVEGASVIVRRAILDELERPVEPFFDLGYGLAFLPGQKAFARITPPGAWGDFSHFQTQRAASGQALKINVTEFWSRTPILPETRCSMLDRDGVAIAPREIEARGALITSSDDSIVRVRLRLTHEGRELSALQPFVRLFQELFQDGPFALLVHSPSRRRRLTELFLQGAAEPERSEAYWKGIARDPVFTSPAMHGNDAVKCLHRLFDRIAEMNEPHLLADPLAENPWQVCSRAGTAFLEVLEAFLTTFPSEDIIRSKDLMCSFGSLNFFERLPALTEVCERLGVDLRLNEEKVNVQVATFSLEAIPDGAIDWFELHPELRAGVLSIPREHWVEILQTGRYLSEEGIIALDPESLASLRKIVGLLGVAEGGALPRLRLFDLLALRQEGAIVELPEEYAPILSSLQNFEQIEPMPLPQGLKADLREYQRHGYDWLAFLYRHRFGACLADDMGLGKTLQAITLLLALHEGVIPRQSKAPHLVVLPPTLLFNWQNELERFAPAMRVREYTGQRRNADFSGVDIVLTTYDLARRDIDLLATLDFDVIVFDEAQAIKNATAARTQALKRLPASFRLCLTGTPLENHVGEFISIMEAAVPGIFGNQKKLAAQHEAGLPVLNRAHPFLLRRTKEKILSELPPKIETDLYFPLSDRQKEFYTRAVGDVRDEVLAAYEDRPSQQAGIVALAALMRLRQICISPAMLSPEFEETSPKLDFLAEQLAEIVDAGHAAIVFSQFVKALDLVGRTLEAAELPFIRLDGSTPTPRRKELVESFQSGTAPGIFLISLKTGGAGLNLTRASYVYHLDPWWNPAVENQASDRAHRIGQKSSVYVQRLLMRHTIEEKMMALKLRKKSLFDAVVERSESVTSTGETTLSSSDFQFLLSGEELAR